MSDTVRAPFTPEQILAIEAWQASGLVHPLTCGAEGHDPADRSLAVRAEGLYCPKDGCAYTQEWVPYMCASPKTVAVLEAQRVWWNQL